MKRGTAPLSPLAPPPGEAVTCVRGANQGEPDPNAPVSSLTLRWMYALMAHCPGWKSQWERRVAGDQASDLDLFCSYHHRIAALVDALPHAPSVNALALQSLERVLLAQFPTDDAWRKAIRHRVGLVRARGKTRKHSGVYWPRILAERRSALVLKRQPDGAWASRKGAAAVQVLAQSGADRRHFLQTLMEIPGLQRIEIPLFMDFKGAPAVAIEIKRALASRTTLAMAARKEGRTWNLALRRIRSMGLNGCFDAAGQTVIVDPRHVESMKHEVSHWLLGHGVGRSGAGEMEQKEKEVEALLKRLFRASAHKS